MKIYKTIGNFLDDLMMLDAAKEAEERCYLGVQTDIVPELRGIIINRTLKSMKARTKFGKFARKHKLALFDMDLIGAAAFEHKKVDLDKITENLRLADVSRRDTIALKHRISHSRALKQRLIAIETDKKKITAGKDEKKENEEKSIPTLLEKVYAQKGMFGKKNSFYKNNEPPSGSFSDYTEICADLCFAESAVKLNIKKDSTFKRSTLKDLFNFIMGRILWKLDNTSKMHNPLGEFIKKYSLPETEIVLISTLIGEEEGIEVPNKGFVNSFFEVNYDSSALKKHGLWIARSCFFGGIDYEVSMKAKKGIRGLSYTEEDEETDEMMKRDCMDKQPFRVEKPKQTFKDVILPDEMIKKMKDAVDQIGNSDLIFNEWGLGKTIRYGQGITLNFAGPPGTGKTLAAGAIANYLSKKLLVIRYDQLQNMYVGETEKRIALAFQEAEKRDAVLFFDEADAIAQKRANAFRSWEVSQINVLLKELERFKGVCIFATNLIRSYDPAFERRITLHMQFLLPNQDQRVSIFENHFAKKKALARDVDFNSIARKHVLSGGDIKNVVLTSARIAANDRKNKGRKITMRHLEEASNIIQQNKKVFGYNVNASQLNYFG